MLLIGIIGGLLGYFYTARPIRLVARRGLGELAIFLTFGPLLTLGALFAISSNTVELFSPEFYKAIYIGIPFGFLTTNILYINQFPDTNSDAKTGKNHLNEIWENLEVYFHGGVSFNPYKKEFNNVISNPDFKYYEIYNASEGFFAIQDSNDRNDLLLMLDYGIFYEFIEINGMKQSEKIIDLSQVEIGKNYYSS